MGIVMVPLFLDKILESYMVALLYNINKMFFEFFDYHRVQVSQLCLNHIVYEI